MSNAAQKQPDASKSIAWVVSIGIHVGVGILAFFITWSVVRIEDKPARIVTSIWHEQPIHEEAKLQLSTPLLPAQEVELPELLPPTQNATIQDGFAVLHEIHSGGEIPELAIRKQETEVQFMGLDAVAAERIVYVVDASGSMLLHLSTILDELERSLRTLHPKQKFGIMFFQQDRAIPVPPKRTLVSANAANISTAMKWIHESGKVIPSGGSNPINAMKSAMKLKPDVVYLLSENITGAGRYEIPVDALLDELDALNPIDERNGLRRVQINCIAYLTRDPHHTMQRIAEIHGGNDGYTFIERGRVEQ